MEDNETDNKKARVKRKWLKGKGKERRLEGREGEMM